MIEWQSDFGISSVALEIENIVHISTLREGWPPDRMSGPIEDISEKELSLKGGGDRCEKIEHLYIWRARENNMISAFPKIWVKWFSAYYTTVWYHCI